MTTGARAFADTNIVLRLLNTSHPQSASVAQLVTQTRAGGFELWINRQVIREYLVNVSRPGFFAEPLPIGQIDRQIRFLRSSFQVADETDAVTDQLMDLLRTYPSGGKQVHDVNIVATMLVYGISTLLTINVSDMERFESRIRIISPA